MAIGTGKQRVLVAPDAFKGTITAGDVAAAIAAGLAEVGLAADPCPVADGGEGTAGIVGRALGGEPRRTAVGDALGRTVDAEFWLVGEDAYLDLAEASGLQRLDTAELDPGRASTAGTGELMLAAVAAGARRIFVAAGGSATVDGGAGAVAAIEAGRGLSGVELTVLCDVATVFEDAPAIYGPQKGASPAVVGLLEERLVALATSLPRDPRRLAMGGAAGGFAGGLWAALDARLVPGAPFVLDLLGFNARLRDAAAVIFGEGRLDSQSFLGKIGGEIVARAKAAGVPAYAAVGRDELDGPSAGYGIAAVVEAGDPVALRRAGAALGGIIGGAI
jgi:glycerate kinase